MAFGCVDFPRKDPMCPLVDRRGIECPWEVGLLLAMIGVGFNIQVAPI